MLQLTSASQEVLCTLLNCNYYMLFISGADGGLDFQCIRVGDEAKQSIQLKNKGKYDIEYKYVE